MSDNICLSAEATLLLLQERAAELGEEIQMHQRNLELATARREELLFMIVQLGRKPRARKPRPEGLPPRTPAVSDPATDAQPEPANDPVSIFGAPSGAIVEAA